jgi:short-subunit dehydrogenase
MQVRAFVTGASGGIGKAIAAELMSRGYEVIAAARDDAHLAETPCHARMSMDITDPASVGQVIAAAGAIDVLVNSAGIGVGGPTEHVPVAAAMREFDVNFFGAARTITAVLPQMRARGSGVIVNISSLSAQAPWPFGGYYAASKAALEALSDALAMELAEFGVRIVIVEPGIVDTKFGERFTVHGSDDPAYAAAYARWTQQFAGQHTSPEAVGRAVADAIGGNRRVRRVIVGADAAEVIGKRQELPEEDFDAWFRSARGISGELPGTDADPPW